MDIEWAKDGLDGKLYIVQARPETVSVPAQRDDAGDLRARRQRAGVARRGPVGRREGSPPARRAHR